MRKLFDSYYAIFENLNVFEIAEKREIEVNCIIEAGCHDGTDTVLLQNCFKPKTYLAFEPDTTARLKATALLAQHQMHSIQVLDFGLSDKDSSGYLKYEAEGAGSGSSHFGDIGEEFVSVRAFDKHFDIGNHNALLWLDVEGHTSQVLSGMKNALDNVVLARIEVQLHTRSPNFKQDYEHVIQLMKKASLIPIYGPIYPGYFGDLLFIKSTEASILDQIRSRVLKIHLFLLHQVIYPTLGKPEK